MSDTDPRKWIMPEYPPDVCTVRGAKSGELYHLNDDGCWECEDDPESEEDWDDVLSFERELTEVRPDV